MITPRRILQFLVPLLILGGAYGVLALLEANKPEARPTRPDFRPPTVEVLEAALPSEPIHFQVASQGNVEPRTEIQLVAQVSGKVLDIADTFIDGGFFDANVPLVQLEKGDYEAILKQREADLAQATLTVAQEEAEAAAAIEQWELRGSNTPPTDLVLRKPQLVRARAVESAAKHALEKAKADVRRTGIQAPFAGRVRQRLVDVGQFVPVGTPVATVYAVDFAEVRLPVSDEDLEFLDMPFTLRPVDETPRGPTVKLFGTYAGRSWTWEGKIHRTAGAIDSGTRRVELVARVPNPFAGSEVSHPPLQVGLFVRAEIEGKTTKDWLPVPRNAIHGGTSVYVVDQDWRLRIRTVEIGRKERDQVWISGNLEAGELVCVSNLQTVIDGMLVRIAGAEVPERVQAAIDERNQITETPKSKEK